jgi:hypothetical protein
MNTDRPQLQYDGPIDPEVPETITKRHGGAAMRVTLACFIIFSEIVFVDLIAGAGLEYVVSSIAITAALLVQIAFAIRDDAPTPADVVVFIFNWLFLDLAPKIQLLSTPGTLVNTSSVVADQVLQTNLLCALFIVIFSVAYGSMNARSAGRRAAQAAEAAEAAELPTPETSTAPARAPLGQWGIAVALLVCVLVVGGLGHTAYHVAETPGLSPGDMIIRKFLLFIPSATLLIVLHETVRSGRKLQFSRVCVLTLLFLLVVATENPLTEKRNGLGPVYLSLIFVLFEPKLRSQNRRLILLVVSMVLIFPAITVFTHNHSHVYSDIDIDEVGSTLKDHYLSTHYDAWANIYTTVEMVNKQGIHWGKQLLGGILFYVPSSIWHAKPLATGIVIGNYLIATYSMWFTNLSAPLIAEAYIDFGTAGVVIYAVGLGWLVAAINRLAARGRTWLGFPLGAYAAFFLMFALRGSLMIAFAYVTGGLLAFLAASAMLGSGSRSMGHRYFRTDLQPPLQIHGLSR